VGQQQQQQQQQLAHFFAWGLWIDKTTRARHARIRPTTLSEASNGGGELGFHDSDQIQGHCQMR